MVFAHWKFWMFKIWWKKPSLYGYGQMKFMLYFATTHTSPSMRNRRTFSKHAAYPDLDASTSLFGVYDGHGGKLVVKLCAKYLHQHVLKREAYAVGDIRTSVHRAFSGDMEFKQNNFMYAEKQIVTADPKKVLF